MSGADITARFFADVVRRWAAHHGYSAQSARVHIHDRSALVACGPRDSGVVIAVMADSFDDALDQIVKTLLAVMGEDGDYTMALEESVNAARARRDREATTPAQDER
jgi:hypothetical protein